MQAYWTTTKTDGTPITDGRLCRVVDPEDGSTPIRVYGRTEAEIFSKIERTMMTAQATLARGREQGPGNREQNGAQPNNGRGAAPPPSSQPNPAILTPDETMRLTADLQNPAKSADAAYRLAESERAKRTDAQESYLGICRQWRAQHPEFYGHQFNRNLLITSALLSVGNDLTRITLEVLDNTYRYLEGRGDLLTESDVTPKEPANDNHQPSTAQPGGSLEVVPARPRNGVVSASSHRSNRLGAPQQPQWKPKYSLEEISKLTTKETAALNQPGHPRHKEYVEACDYWYSGAQATA